MSDRWPKYAKLHGSALRLIYDANRSADWQMYERPRDCGDWRVPVQRKHVPIDPTDEGSLSKVIFVYDPGFPEWPRYSHQHPAAGELLPCTEEAFNEDCGYPHAKVPS